jgi:hypothetical protein
MLHSEAYKKLNYGPALKVLNWFHEKIRLEVNKKKRGKDRYRIINDGEIAFTYSEAALRGLTSHKFRRALKDLHGFGFIDVVKPGSALKGDWTQFALSERWREFGTPNFKGLGVPRSARWINFGFGAKRKSRFSRGN